ncbi:hypothetical protein GCM10009749_05980 [Agromyces neolithicus]|uniref:Uncharacterized protein n=1 Tax=Agromyces neolithicus TaxID=269420 RepID=A0ABN2LWC5_9MICO
MTFAIVAAETFGSPLMTRETVFTPTPARAATCRIVGRERAPSAAELESDNGVTVCSPMCKMDLTIHIIMV